MGTQTVIINPDRFVATRVARAPQEVSPVRLRLKLRAAGLAQKSARAAKPDLTAPPLAFDHLTKILEQQLWTRLLVRLISR